MRCLVSIVAGLGWCVSVRGDVVYPRYASAVREADPEEVADVLAYEQQKDTHYHKPDYMPIYDMEGSGHAGEPHHHPGIRRITFHGRLNVKPCRRDDCGYPEDPNCHCCGGRPREGELGEHEEPQKGGNNVGYAEAEGFGTAEMQFDAEGFGDTENGEGENTCHRRKCLDGRYLDVFGILERRRYHEGGAMYPTKRSVGDEDDDSAEDYDEEFAVEERNFTKYKPYWYSKKFHGGPPPKCVETFTLVKFVVKGGFLQYGQSCWRKLNYRSGKSCTQGCHVTLDCRYPPCHRPCEYPLDLTMFIDNSKTMGQRRLDTIVKPIALDIIDGVDPGSPIIDMGLGRMDEIAEIEFAPKARHRRSEVTNYVRQLESTRIALSLVDIAEQVAAILGPRMQQQRHPGRPNPVMVILLHGNNVLPVDEPAYTAALEEIYDSPNAVTPVCLLVDNVAPPVTEDVARFCGCEFPNNCPNLIYVDGDSPDELARVARRIKLRMCLAQKQRLGHNYESGHPDEMGEDDGWAEVLDAEGSPHFVAPGGIELAEHVDYSGAIHTAASVRSDGLMADDRGGATYDPYSGYYYGKPSKFNKYPPPPTPYGYGSGYGYPPGSDSQTYEKSFDTKNGHYNMGVTFNKTAHSSGNLFNKQNWQKKYPPATYHPYIPPQAPCLSMETKDVDYQTIHKSIGFDAFFTGVSRKLGQAYQVPPQQLVCCCPSPQPSVQHQQTKFMGANIKGGISYKVFVLDADKSYPGYATPMQVADRFRTLVGSDFSDSNALGPYMSPRTTLTGLEVVDTSPYEPQVQESIEQYQGLVRGGQKGQYQPYRPIPPAYIDENTQLAYKVLNINLTLCAAYLKRGSQIQNQAYYRGKASGECLMARAFTNGDSGRCEPFTATDTSGLDADVVDALKQLEVITHDQAAIESITRDGGEQLALFDLSGGLPDPLGLSPVRYSGGKPSFNLCPSNHQPSYKRPIRDAMRNLNKISASA